MKKILPLPLTTAIFAVAGFLVRRWQLSEAWEPGGFVMPGHPATLALIIVLVIGAAAAFALSHWCAGTYDGYLGGFQTSAVWGPLPYLFAGVALARGGVVGVLAYRAGEETRKLGLVLAVVFVLMGAAAGWMGFMGRRRTPLSKAERIFLMVPAYGACLWLVYLYQTHTSNPERMDYLFLLLGAAASILALYTVAGFAFEETPHAVRCGWYCALAVMLLVTDLADGRDSMTVSVEVGLAALLLTQQCVLMYRGQHPAQMELPPETTQETGESEE